MEEITIKEEDCKKRLDNFILEHFLEFSRSQIKTFIEKEDIKVNGKKVKAGYALKIGDIITFNKPENISNEILPEDISLDIVYEDEYLAVINKPQGMIVHPAGKITSGTLVNALLYRFKKLSSINGEDRPGIVHRIDKDTSGLLLIAKDDKTHLALQQQIQTKVCHRNYLAVCYGKFKKDSGDVENYLSHSAKQYEKFVVSRFGEGRYAHTKYKVLKYFEGYSLVEFELKTGRTHQIRVHAEYLGHSVVGDKLYGEKKGQEKNLLGQLLHAYKISFIHPITNQNMEFTSELPEYFKEFLHEKKLDI